MADTDFSRSTADLFFMKHDQNMELRKYRTFFPEDVLKTFCGSGEPNMWFVYEENQMHLIGESDLLTLFLPEAQDFDKQHWSLCFGNNDIYASYFEHLTPQAFQAAGFSKFLSLQRVDREIYTQLTDPIWLVHGNQSLGEIPFPRDEINTFRKFLYLMTSLGGRERNMHLLAHHEFMESARLRRRKFIENHDLDHARDVWLRNVERIIDTPHNQIPSTTSIFDLDRADYKANAIERYMVFWEAAPNEEFILTDAAFGGFEGGQIGAKKNSKIDMTPLELEQHLYTRDSMWHQIYVLSPTLAVALCHPTLMHPELTKLQRKRWGLRKSLLESLPHSLPHRYYKDMKKSDMSFAKEGWPIPPEVEKYFATSNSRGGYDRRKDEDVVFRIHRLQPGQTSLVNSVLLHNQELGPKIKAVCVRPPTSYQSFFQSLRQFQHDPWPKYSEEKQNDYGPLIQRLEQYLSQTLPPTPPNHPSNYAYQPLPSHQMFESRPTFGNMHYTSVSSGDVPRYDDHFDPGHPVHIQAHSSTQSSLTSSFTPSSQSSYSQSSASSQSSTSTKTTSVGDTPRFEPKQFEHQQRRNKSPMRRDHNSNQDRSLTDTSVHRSNTSGKSQRSKAEKAKSLNIVIEKTLQEANALSAANGNASGFLSACGYGHMEGQMNGYNNYQGAHTRGRNPEPAIRSLPSSNPSSKRTSPNPTRTEPDRLAQQMMPPPPPVHSNPSSHGSGMPEKKNYATDRPTLQHRARTETSPVIQARPSIHSLQSGQFNVPELQLPLQRRGTIHSPERQYVPEIAPQQPPRRGQHSPDKPAYGELNQSQQRPLTQRSVTNPEDRHNIGYERIPQVDRAPLVDARGRRYEPVRVDQQPQRNVNERGRPQETRTEQSPAAHERSAQQQQVIDSVRERLHQVVNSESQPQPQRSANRSPERKPEPQRNPAQTANGHQYQMVAPSGPPTRARPTGGDSQTQSQPPRPVQQPQQAQIQQAPVPQPLQQQQQPQHSNSSNLSHSNCNCLCSHRRASHRRQIPRPQPSTQYALESRLSVVVR
ncbi:hypothetical protein K440DRAFT_235809 [Wilcoxina mikolae CBS 423.85]|nr:hypothetical protein K440DRAFT_235809 [Wilcoxina mikolae CBS 423.85]